MDFQLSGSRSGSARPKDSCCDPFQCHSVRKVKGLRCIPQKIITQHPSLHINTEDKLCTPCRKKVTQLPVEDTDVVLTDDDSSSKVRPVSSCSTITAADDVFESRQHELAIINKSLEVLGESPVCTRKVDTRVNYSLRKVRAIQTTVKRKLELIAGVPLDEAECSHNQNEIISANEMIEQLKQKFHSCVKQSEKVQVLTVLPKSWSMRRIEDEFAASNYMVRKVKKLVEEKGVLSTPNQKAGRALSVSVVDDVKAFYCNEMTSRLMPGMKDYVSVRDAAGQRKHAQKRLVLCNLKEAFESFKLSYPEHKIGFSKFAELRPKECVLAGASGTHAVCVCTIHQNIKLMFQGAKLETICEKYGYRNCLAETQCNPPRIECHLGNCKECPGIELLQSRLEQHFDEQMIDQIQYKQWTTTDRATLETKVQSVDEFIGDSSMCSRL